jgi:hypothetical protein
MKSEKFCSQLSTYFKRHEGLGQEDFQAVLRTAGETETTQENIRDWFQLDEGDPPWSSVSFLFIILK